MDDKKDLEYQAGQQEDEEGGSEEPKPANAGQKPQPGDQGPEEEEEAPGVEEVHNCPWSDMTVAEIRHHPVQPEPVQFSRPFMQHLMWKRCPSNLAL